MPCGCSAFLADSYLIQNRYIDYSFKYLVDSYHYLFGRCVQGVYFCFLHDLFSDYGLLRFKTNFEGPF